MLTQNIQRSWYQHFNVVTLLLLPFSVLFCAIVTIRRVLYKIKVFSQTVFPVPVIVVGNITVGGTGKTPLVIALAHYLTQKGYRPGVVSRGYGGSSTRWPQLVTAQSSAEEVGDEAVLLARRSSCPVCVSPNRVEAVEMLLKHQACNLIISDDGLQHLALGRSIEIAVIDSERRFGNGLCLPAGPMRELSARLNKVDLVVSNGDARHNEQEMRLVTSEFIHVNDINKTKALGEFSGQTAHAVSGIGNNERFFKTLEDLSIVIERHPYPDHYAFEAEDLDFGQDIPILMTEKDAVKCCRFPLLNAWYLKVDANLSHKFYLQLDNLLGKNEH